MIGEPMIPTEETPSDPAPEPAVALWHRTGRRGKWREVGRAASRVEALALIGTLRKNGGDWIIRPIGSDPNDVAAG